MFTFHVLRSTRYKFMKMELRKTFQFEAAHLLPLLPAWALAGAWLLQQSGARLRPLMFGLLALLAGVGIATLPWQAAKSFHYAVHPAVALIALVALVVAAGVWRAWGRTARALALSATALVSATMLAGALAYLPALDVRPEAAVVRQARPAKAPASPRRASCCAHRSSPIPDPAGPRCP